MSEPQKDPQSPHELPRAEVKPHKWSFPVVWVVPVLAAVVAGYLVYHRASEYGPKLTIRFRDASGLKAGETPIRYRGVPIGEVRSIELSKDRQHAEVQARLQRSAAAVAREGSIFWIVRPEIGLGNITGLGTIVAGPHIEVLPGDGAPKTEFVGLQGTPVTSEPKALQIVLITSRLGSLKSGSPVYYRGIEVGAVQDARLSADASAVHIDLAIKQRYAPLIRGGTKFWNVSGVEMKLSLFHGAEVNVESLKSLVAGGITFASPNDPREQPAKNGTSFRLYDEPKKEWLEWTPSIVIPPEK
jgi:paraquat-inducible protein B